MAERSMEVHPSLVRPQQRPLSLWHGLEWIPWRAAGTDLDIWERVSHFYSGTGGRFT